MNIRPHCLRFGLRLGLGLALAVGAATVQAYPVDSYDDTGIRRLEYARRVEDDTIHAVKQPRGALLRAAEVEPRLLDQPGMELPPADPAFSAELASLVGHDDRYAIAILDLSTPGQPRYGQMNDTALFNPGSVGKVVVILGLFQALADTYPSDPAARQRVLKETPVEADEFILTDEHPVKFFHLDDNQIEVRNFEIGDRGTLYEWLDWMMSASSNAAAAIVQRETLLLRHFGTRYPVPRAEADAFLRKGGAGLMVEAFHTPITRNGLDIKALRQGGFFTQTGKQRIPGTSSHASARELIHYLLRMEQGRLVDAYSSREIKRLMYMTERRIRYVSSPRLGKAAVYVKSGSLHKCAPEPGYDCVEYHGNKENFMNTMVVVESPARGRSQYYLVALMSNVLRKNSAVEHQTMATRIQRLMERDHPSPAGEEQTLGGGQVDPNVEGEGARSGAAEGGSPRDAEGSAAEVRRR
jgi:hypothetical protein